MNYGKKGVRAKQKALNSKSVKWGRKFVLTCVKVILIAVIGTGICGAAAGIGAFKGILANTPDVRLSGVVASGEATIVYDNAGNELDQYVSSNSNRIVITDINLVPQHLGQAFVAVEDERFYQHNGIDVQGMFRAGFRFIMTMGREKQGASTITQQLLKNTIFTDWTEENNNMIKMVKRKIQEQYLALDITKKLSKDEILLRYMNVINLGQNTLGIESASLRYFGKSCSELTLSECAVIAAITQNPSKYNPITHPEQNVNRRETCLNKMLELEFISPAEYDAAMADTEAVYERIGNYNTDYKASTSTTSGSYFSDALYEQVKNDLVTAGYSEIAAENLLTSGGLRIESTMDPTIQAIADEAFADEANYPTNVKWYLNYALTIHDNAGEDHNFSKENMTSWFKENGQTKFNLIFSSQDEAYEAAAAYRTAMLESLGVADEEDNYDETVSMTPQPQAAMVIEDQTTGYIVAMVGGRGTKEGRRTLNRATSANRSPGSTFKVLASFAPALDSAGLTLATVYNDAPFNYDGGRPVNNWYKTGYRGIQSIREAIRESMNIIAVKNLTVISPQLGYDYLLNFGFTTLTDGVEINGDIYSDVNQTLALGGLTYGVSPYELNAAFAGIANMGLYVEPKLYSRVTDADGNVILDNTTPAQRQVIKETTAFLLTDAMVDVVTSGTGSRVNFGNMAIAAKTGTSTGTKDVWLTGFTPYYTCTIWTGYDNSIDMSTKTGNDESAVSKTLWRAIMQRIHENLPNTSFPVPSGIVQAQVCSQSGRLPIPGLCDGHVKTEYFAEGTVPTESCSVHYQGNICDYDQLPAAPECPFPVPGIITLPLQEDPSLLTGSSTITVNPDGTQTVNTPNASSQCQHDATFFANPDYEAIINQQQWEIDQRNAAAQAAIDSQQPAEPPAE